MLIDLICAATLLLALIKGWSKGLIIALFSLLAWLIGILAALRLSVAVAAWLQQYDAIATRYVPLLAFVLVFVAAVLLVRLGARMLQGFAELLYMGWANRIAGALLYSFMYLFLLSVFLFYAVQLSIITPAGLHHSVTAPWLQQMAPLLLNLLGKMLPVVTTWLQQLQQFFQQAQPSAAITMLPPGAGCGIFG